VIVDAFLANDEIDLAKFRISFLQGKVSRFYIGESRQTHQGRDKALHFSKQAKKLESISKKIEIVEIPPVKGGSDSMTAREREETQRDWFLKFVANKHPDDVIVFTDIDEIPSMEQLDWSEENLEQAEIRTLPMQFAFRFANWLLRPVNQDYRPGVILRGRGFKPLLRNSDLPPVPGEKGAHLSYVGFGAAQLMEKFSSFSHTELDIKHLYQDSVLEFANEWGIDHIGRPGQPGFGLLAPANSSHMNSVLREAVAAVPEWSRDFPRKSFVRRLVASSALSSFRSSGREAYLMDPTSPVLSGRFLRHLVSIAIHTTIRLTRAGRLLKRWGVVG